MQQDCDLIIVGDGELRTDLENQVNTLQLHHKVHFVGTQNNPFPYLAGARFLTLSSRTEAFPMVLIEALALKCPVVATDCPTGPREIVRDGENGLLVENGRCRLIPAGAEVGHADLEAGLSNSGVCRKKMEKAVELGNRLVDGS